MSAHKSPEQIRSQLKHPVVDGDGHWLEYAPVFSEKMRKAGGDLAADGFLAALRSTTDALKMTPEERRRRRVAMPNFWNRQAENTLDRATAMMPKMLYDRLDEIGIIDRKSTRLNSSHVSISYAVFCLKKKKNIIIIKYLEYH